jgi:glycerophosphoryl diester phosphodiesterase
LRLLDLKFPSTLDGMLQRFTSRHALALCLWILAHGSLAAVEIIAHRGASFDAPENTLSAMKLAWEQGADSIELDLWLSRDSKLVVFHDADTKRFESTPRKVSDLSWDELHKLDVGSRKGQNFQSEPIPTLESILATIPAGRRAVLEIKCGPEILPELKRVLRSSKRDSTELAIISFRYDTLKESKKIFPQIEHLFLHDYKKDPATARFPELDPLITRCKEARLEGLNLNFRWPINKDFVASVKTAGLKLFVWTVDDPAVAKELVAAGVDGITTNRPKWLR